MKNDTPIDFWNYDINPILGYRYHPDGKPKAKKEYSKYIKVSDRTKTKS